MASLGHNKLIQWSVVKTWSNITWYCTLHCRNSGRISIRGRTHKRNPIWGIFREYFGEYWQCYNRTTMYEAGWLIPCLTQQYWPGLCLTLISAWISNYVHYKMWDEMTYPFPNFNGCTVEVWEWINNFISHFSVHVITYPCLVLKLEHSYRSR